MNVTDENQDLIGIFTTDADFTVRVWDAALERMTGIPAARAVGKSVLETIPDLESRGLLARFRRVLEEGTVEMLAPAFHRFLIPCPPQFAAGRFDEMRQRVTIAPLMENETIRGLLVTVEDVTARLEHEIELADRLKNADDAVRLGAAKEISHEAENLGEDAASPIIDALGDKNWRVRRELVEGLSRRGAPDAIAALLRAVQERHLDFAVLNSALSVLQATSVKTTEALIEFLAGEDADLRMQAALTLGEQKDARAVPALLAALGDENVNVRFHAIEALGKLRAPEAIEPLVAIAETRDFFLSFAALEALRAIGDAQIVPRVRQLLEDERLREAAVETLGAVGDAEIVSPLIDLLNEDRFLTTVVARALGAIYERLAGDAAKSAAVIERARAQIGESGKENLRATLAAAKNETDSVSLIRLAGWFTDANLSARLAALLENENLREEAARALVAQGASAVDLLLEKLAAGDAQTVPVVARTLGQIGDARAFEPLVELLKTGDAASRHAATGALKALAHPATVQNLCDSLTDPDAAVREAAIRVVGYFGATGCEDRIFEFGEDPDERLRRAALEQLPFIDDERSVPTLIGALKKDSPRLRETAAKALAQVKTGQSVGALRAALTDENAWTRYFAVRALGVLEDAASAEKLSEMAEHDAAEHVRAAAHEVLGGLKL